MLYKVSKYRVIKISSLVEKKHEKRITFDNFQYNGVSISIKNGLKFSFVCDYYTRNKNKLDSKLHENKAHFAHCFLGAKVLIYGNDIGKGLREYVKELYKKE